jgi:hypothetical protein
MFLSSVGDRGLRGALAWPEISCSTPRGTTGKHERFRSQPILRIESPRRGALHLCAGVGRQAPRVLDASRCILVHSNTRNGSGRLLLKGTQGVAECSVAAVGSALCAPSGERTPGVVDATGGHVHGLSSVIYNALSSCSASRSRRSAHRCAAFVISFAQRLPVTTRAIQLVRLRVALVLAASPAAPRRDDMRART